MKVSELIDFLSKVPADTEVFIGGDMEWGSLDTEHVTYIEVYDIWVSDYNNNKTPYISVRGEPSDFVYERGRGMPDYIHKTLGKRMIILLE